LGFAVTVKKKAYGLTFVLLLLLSAVAGLLLVVPAKANFALVIPGPNIVIAGGGSISPFTQSIQRDGNTYFLTSDIEGYSLIVERSNIVLDGMGHLLNCTPYTNDAILFRSVTNVTVKNFEIQGGASAVALMGSSYCTIEGITSTKDVFFSGSDFNIVTKCNAGINLWLASNNNTITKNNITDIFIDRSKKAFNIFYLNNILLDEYLGILGGITFWDNGSVGNYWSNYTVRYPNASEIGYTGIGNTPYVLTRSNYAVKEFPNVTSIDHYPLMYPFDIENDTIALPVREPLPEPESFLLIFVAAVFVISTAGAAAGLFYYRKKRNHQVIKHH
jgi:hypothetical protein